MKLTTADLKVMQDYMDDLCDRCEVIRVLVWDHGDLDDMQGTRTTDDEDINNGSLL